MTFDVRFYTPEELASVEAAERDVASASPSDAASAAPTDERGDEQAPGVNEFAMGDRQRAIFAQIVKRAVEFPPAGTASAGDSWLSYSVQPLGLQLDWTNKTMVLSVAYQHPDTASPAHSVVTNLVQIVEQETKRIAWDCQTKARFTERPGEAVKILQEESQRLAEPESTPDSGPAHPQPRSGSWWSKLLPQRKNRAADGR